MESSFGKIGAFAIRWDPIVTWEHGVAWRTCHWLWEHHYPSPIGSMYGIYTNIGGILMVNVTIYGIHGSYGSWSIIIPWFTRHFPIIFPCFTHHVVSFTMPISFPPHRNAYNDATDATREAQEAIEMLTHECPGFCLRCLFVFPIGNPPFGESIVNIFYFFGTPNQQIQVSGPSFIPKWLEEKSNLNWLIGHLLNH